MRMMTHKIFIDGAVGTTGLQVYDRLKARTDIIVLELDAAHRKDADARFEAMQTADITILCLPDEAARQAVSLADNSDKPIRLIDASSAHRIDQKFTYGMAELASGQAAQIADSDRVSNPGCYPTGFLGLVRPLVAAGILAKHTSLSAFCVSGYSGGGKDMIARYEGGGQSGFGLYGLGIAHKHLPEMQMHAGLDKPPLFMPSVGQFAQGLLVTIPLHQQIMTKSVDAEAILSIYNAAYEGQALVNIQPAQGLTEYGFLTADSLAGTDRMELFVFHSAEASQFILCARLDNLGKGAAGAAVQNMNLMLRLEPTYGLVT